MKCALVSIVVLLLSVSAQAADQIVVAAGAAPLDNVFSKIEAPFAKATGIKLVLNKKTHVTSLEDLTAGKADMASISFTFEDWMNRETKDGFKVGRDD